MARMDPNPASGKLGEWIYYKMRGNCYARKSPAEVNQTERTKMKAMTFGQAAGISRVWRSILDRLIAKPNDLNLRHRLEKALRDWLNSESEKAYFLSRLNEFEFNPKTPLSTRLKVSLSVKWMKNKVVVSIPEIDTAKDIIAPPKPLAIELLITVTGSTIIDPASTFPNNTTHAINCEGIMPATEVEIPYPLKPGTIQVTAAALKYRTGNQYISAITDDEKWTPACVLSVHYEE